MANMELSPIKEAEGGAGLSSSGEDTTATKDASSPNSPFHWGQERFDMTKASSRIDPFHLNWEKAAASISANSPLGGNREGANDIRKATSHSNLSQVNRYWGGTSSTRTSLPRDPFDLDREYVTFTGIRTVYTGISYDAETETENDIDDLDDARCRPLAKINSAQDSCGSLRNTEQSYMMTNGVRGSTATKSSGDRLVSAKWNDGARNNCTMPSLIARRLSMVRSNSVDGQLPPAYNFPLTRSTSLRRISSASDSEVESSTDRRTLPGWALARQVSPHSRIASSPGDIKRRTAVGFSIFRCDGSPISGIHQIHSTSKVRPYDSMTRRRHQNGFSRYAEDCPPRCPESQASQTRRAGGFPVRQYDAARRGGPRPIRAAQEFAVVATVCAVWAFSYGMYLAIF